MNRMCNNGKSTKLSLKEQNLVIQFDESKIFETQYNFCLVSIDS